MHDPSTANAAIPSHRTLRLRFLGKRNDEGIKSTAKLQPLNNCESVVADVAPVVETLRLTLVPVLLTTAVEGENVQLDPSGKPEHDSERLSLNVPPELTRDTGTVTEEPALTVAVGEVSKTW
jgi:hypothetical protein